MGIIIKPHPSVRDPRLERRMIEYHREEMLYGVMFVGAVLVFIALIW